MASGLTLVCPVRGRLKAQARSKDGLSPTEEKFRVDAIRHLIGLGYASENFLIESVIKRFGNSGRNSFRADFAVLDTPVRLINSRSADDVLNHAVILAEIKRDNSSATTAVSYQVAPMLDFTTRQDCVALYWDDVEQRVYWLTRTRESKSLNDGPLADLPTAGGTPGLRRLTYSAIDPNKPLLEVFRRIEDVLHSASIGPHRRFTVILQLLLAKLYDEHQGQSQPSAPLMLQDFAALSIDPGAAYSVVSDLLRNSIRYYQAFLPETVPNSLGVVGETLLEVARILAPIKITAMRQSVIQDFYMYFAKHIYKWDLAQYFTPTPLTEFIVEVLNPQFSEHIKDPACGSADFLTAAFRRGQRQHWPDYASSVWGSDVSSEAVQVSILNMILNGDGKTNIREEDSLAKIGANLQSCDVVVCNPPFGTRITEKSSATLVNFDLGHEWVQDSRGRWYPTDKVLSMQESGILFAEACVKMLRPGGRLALIVPNGYLGNRSTKYLVLREWLLRHTRIGAIVALPRFTFKSSGADVSASIVFCERRRHVLQDGTETEDYEYCVEIVDRVGWVTGDKRGTSVFRRDAMDGTFLVDENGNLMLDSDFPDVLRRIRASDAAQHSQWITKGVNQPRVDTEPGWTVSIAGASNDCYRTLDPKRNCRKFAQVQNAIRVAPYFQLGDVVQFMPERTTSSGDRVTVDASREYRHVEIQDVENGTCRWQTKRGWELPQRARHHAEPGDLFVGGIRNSVRKWFIVGADSRDLIVTNGMHRMRIKPGSEEFLLDLVVGLSSEAYRVQMRGLARGADGLAEITDEDVATVVLPRIENESSRREIEPFVKQLVAGQTSLEAKLQVMLESGRLSFPEPPRQPDHTALL